MRNVIHPINVIMFQFFSLHNPVKKIVVHTHLQIHEEYEVNLKSMDYGPKKMKIESC